MTCEQRDISTTQLETIFEFDPDRMSIRPTSRQRSVVQIAHGMTSNWDRSGYAVFERRNPSLLTELFETRSAWQTHLQRLQARSRSRQHHDIRRLLRSRKLSRYFAFEALKRSHRLSNANVETIRDLAKRFDPFRPVEGEAVVLRSVSYRPGHHRIVQDFGVLRRMHQFAVSDILRHLHPPARAAETVQRWDAEGPRGHRSSLA